MYINSEILHHKKISKFDITEQLKINENIIRSIHLFNVKKNYTFNSFIKEHTHSLELLDNYKDLSLDDASFSLDSIYSLTNGKVSYNAACELYKKAYYFSKSKLICPITSPKLLFL